MQHALKIFLASGQLFTPSHFIEACADRNECFDYIFSSMDRPNTPTYEVNQTSRAELLADCSVFETLLVATKIQNVVANMASIHSANAAHPRASAVSDWRHL